MVLRALISLHALDNLSTTHSTLDLDSVVCRASGSCRASASDVELFDDVDVMNGAPRMTMGEQRGRGASRSLYFLYAGAVFLFLWRFKVMFGFGVMFICTLTGWHWQDALLILSSVILFIPSLNFYFYVSSVFIQLLITTWYLHNLLCYESIQTNALIYTILDSTLSDLSFGQYFIGLFIA